jgi:hypothetical protein
MDKNWLIRTKSNHILGPVSKDKVLELYKNGSIKPDEICSGNGYWFFIRETDMVSRFLLGQELQGFNPISEAKDVLTSSSENAEVHETSEDITMVGGVDLSLLNSQPQEQEPEPESPNSPSPAVAEISIPETKKKNNEPLKIKTSVQTPKKALKKQSYLKYVGIIAFLCLFLLVYFRKAIIRSLFEGEVTTHSFSLINTAHAQDKEPEQKKKLLDSSFALEEVTFKPSIGLDGFKVISTFDIEEISCEDLSNDIHQLGIVLHPPEVINENFLIKMRNCVLKLSDSHPVKRWMKWVAQSKPLTQKQQEKQKFLVDIINSQFNLITDVKIRNKLVSIIDETPQTSLPELTLKSYLYLMVGNVTRSDNILKEFINASPRENWEKNGLHGSFYHFLAKEQFAQLLKRMSRHPADRRVFELFSLYLQSFYNDETLLQIADDINTASTEAKLDLRNIQGIAPSFVKYLRLTKMGETPRFNALRDLNKSPLDFQSHWVWPFFEITPLISEFMVPELERVEKSDETWFIYLMNDEKLADLFSKKVGKSFLPGRRPYLKKNLNLPPKFMMSLYKLIELGDVNQELVLKTVDHLIHE